ncbi:MAG TPA: hypothetical protein VKE30_01700 [Chthoniobacterales bacterium]|nr:hypothetical protein [Chthoniobacterales bacterium]
MKISILSIGVALAALATSTFGAAKMTCRVTGKTIDKCCCEMKEGKFYCKLTKKTYDECCCDM